MTAPTAPAPVAAETGTDRASFRDLLAAEWIKFWSLRSMPWALGLTALLIVFVAVQFALDDYNHWDNPRRPEDARFDRAMALRDAFPDLAAVILMLAAATIGALIIVGEYSSGLIRTTFAAVPARRSVVAAKAAVVTAVLTGYGAIVVLATFIASQAILDGRDGGLSITDGMAIRVLAASMLLAPVSALVGLGIGALIRHGATAITVVTVALLMVPMLLGDTPRWSLELKQATPFNAWDRLVTPDFMARRMADVASISESWIVLAVWPVAGLLLALITVQRRDV